MLYWKPAVAAERPRDLGLLECLACLFQVGFKGVTVKSIIKSFLPSSSASVHLLFWGGFAFILCSASLFLFFLFFCNHTLAPAVFRLLQKCSRARDGTCNLTEFCGRSSACFVANAPNLARPNLHDTVDLALTHVCRRLGSSSSSLV